MSTLKSSALAAGILAAMAVTFATPALAQSTDRVSRIPRVHPPAPGGVALDRLSAGGTDDLDRPAKGAEAEAQGFERGGGQHPETPPSRMRSRRFTVSSAV